MDGLKMLGAIEVLPGQAHDTLCIDGETVNAAEAVRTMVKAHQKLVRELRRRNSKQRQALTQIRFLTESVKLKRRYKT